MGRKIKIALAGNPNSGKTTIFNNLTGARQHVGNYPGVTVEKKQGSCRHDGVEIDVVDLPGTYSLTAYSIEEVVARNFIIEEKPDVVVDIIDASNIERNLYLATQFMELGVPLVLALNMSDVAKARGIEFDLRKLSELLASPVVPTVGHKGRGMKELLDAVVALATNPRRQARPHVNYGREIEQEIEKIQNLLEQDGLLTRKYDSRWLAIKLLENDSDVRDKVSSPELLAAVEKSAARIEKIFGDPPEIVIADRRYGFISGACQEAVRFTVEARHSLSDKIDAVMTNRILGFPIFFGLMYLVFSLTFTLGEAPMGWIESFFGWLSGFVAGFWPRGSDSVLKSLLVDGVIGGVGGVIVFLPNILLLFLAIALLEDSGYMARAAFIMDRLMHKIGLPGKSFIPMLIGFGCSVPAVMATRTLDNRRDRLTTMLVVPLMSCGARLTIYALIIPAFFARKWQAPMLWLIYVIGIALAIAAAKLLRSTLFKGASTPFVMELPPYRVPTVKGVLIHMWERGWLYVKKAGTIILAVSILLWAMTSFPRKRAFNRDYDAQAARARADYLASLEHVGLELGLGGKSQLLVEAIQAELDMRAAQERYWPNERGFIAAVRRKDAVIRVLERRRGGEILARFLEVRQAVREARRCLADAVRSGRLEQGSPEYLALKHRCDAELEALKRAEPRIYAAVVWFLDQAEGPFERAMARIKAQRRAEQLAYSLAGRAGHALEPLLRPMGFDWRIGTALIGAFAAKEVFVAQMGIIHSVGQEGQDTVALRQRLRNEYTPLVGFCIMLFCLVSMPCMATVAVTRRESGSWGWALLQLGGLTALAYVLTTAVFQAGRLLGAG